MKRTPKKITKEEALQKLQERHTLKINGIDCELHLYLHSKEYFSILLNTYELKYSQIRDSYSLCQNTDNNNAILEYIKLNSEVKIIEKESNKVGYYNIVFKNSCDGSVKYLHGDDVLKYNETMEDFNKFLDDNKKRYEQINFDNYILLTNSNSVRTTHQLEKDKNIHKDYKEFDILDENLFNQIIEKFKKRNYGIIREMSGTTFMHIYHNCELIEYGTTHKRILFEFHRSEDEIHIHKDLNINPINDYNKFIRKNKIRKILS